MHLEIFDDNDVICSTIHLLDMARKCVEKSLRHFLNMDILVNIAHTSFRFITCILEIQMEGSVSQNVDISRSFHFMKSRKLFFKK